MLLSIIGVITILIVGLLLGSIAENRWKMSKYVSKVLPYVYVS